MAFKTLLVLVLCFAETVFSNTTTSTAIPYDDSQIDYSEGTSVEDKYSLPPENVGVSGARNSTQVVTSLARILDFYNTELLAGDFPRFKGGLSHGCQKDVETYIVGLTKAENWALKSKYLTTLVINVNI